MTAVTASGHKKLASKFDFFLACFYYQKHLETKILNKNDISKVHNERMLYLKTKLIF